MVMAIEGTFDYVFDVSTVAGAAGPLQGRPREPLARTDRRLLGHAPLLEAVEYQREAWQLYARITLTGGEGRHASVRSASFSVDRGLVRVLRQGDVLYISRTLCAGLGLSILRDGQLVAAAGAITSVPLGTDVSARHPGDLVEQAEQIFRTRDPQYRTRESPIELSVAGVTRILHGGRPTLGPYEVFVRHGFLRGIPGTDESLSIERRGVCPDTAAHTTAQLLDEEGLRLSRDP